MAATKGLVVAPVLRTFMEAEALPGTGVDAATFWQGFWLAFGLMVWIGLYDTCFLDWVLFANLPMFRLAGYSASVGNASPELKEISDYVAEARYGDGFAEIIEHMIKEKLI